MKIFLLIFTVAVFAATVLGQVETAKPDIKFIGWSPKTACGDASFVKSKTDVLECDQKIVDDTVIRYLYFNGVFIAVAVLKDDNYAVSDVYIFNESGKRILVEPKEWFIKYSKSFEDRTTLGVEYRLDPNMVAKKVGNPFSWASALGAIAAGMATQQTVTTTTGNIYDNRGNSGTYNSQSTTTAPDYAARAQAREVQVQRVARASAKAEIVRTTALRANTVDSGEHVAGKVYFKLNKKAQHGTFVLFIGDIGYAFEFTQVKKQ